MPSKVTSVMSNVNVTTTCWSVLFGEGGNGENNSFVSDHLTIISCHFRSAVTFQLNANPEVSEGIGATGKVFHYSEPDAGIFINRQGPASANDPIL